ncbi:MAG: hypothetical protein UY41_C0057G0001 [Candidatus Moranbacteria bacterium GW2011_GWE1_49_15]|nr:MAG: hypothetical protein UY41_C0057G0001 [Candidatus Moranbacteria bacterium GW2011_GWE1_49_15]
MNESFRYDKGLGDAAIYMRLLNSAGEFYDFLATSFVSVENANCQLLMTEFPDSSTEQSWYYVTFESPAGGPFAIEIVLVSTAEVIGYDTVFSSTEASEAGETSIGDLLDIVIGRFAKINKPPMIDFLTAANMTMDIIYRRLMTKKSELILGSFSQAVLANASTVTLPTDFQGFFERPYISGSTWHLDPLPGEYRASLTTPGRPQFYELRGTTMTLFPRTSAALTIVGQYYKKPVKFTALTNVIPYNGLIDNVLQEGSIAVGMTGMGALLDAQFQAIMSKMIDEVLAFRSPRTVRFHYTYENSQRMRGAHPDYFNV